MVLSCNYETIVNSLIKVNTVVDDSMTSDDMKNILISVSKDAGVRLIGVSKFITYKLLLPVENYTLNMDEGEEDTLIQLKAKEILSFLNAYKSLYERTVSEVIFELNERKQVKCTVIEEDASEDALMAKEMGEELKKYPSQWIFNQVPIKPNMINFINISAGDLELKTIDSQQLRVYTSCLLPVMQNVTSMFGKLMIDEKYVVAFNNAYTAIMPNNLPISGVNITYKAVSFIDKIICISDSIEVGKTATHMYFKTDESESFIVYDSKLANYQHHVDMISNEHGVIINRRHLRDILKRLSLTDENIECSLKLDENVLMFSNSKYQQGVDLINVKAMDEYSDIKFRMLPQVLDKAMLGADANCTADMFVYYNKEASVLIFTDADGFWFTVVRVKIA